MTTIEIFAAAVITALVTCVTFLFKQNSRLGHRLDSLSQRIGILQGFTMAVRGCPIDGCKLKNSIPTEFDVAGVAAETFSIKPNKPPKIEP